MKETTVILKNVSEGFGSAKITTRGEPVSYVAITPFFDERDLPRMQPYLSFASSERVYAYDVMKTLVDNYSEVLNDEQMNVILDAIFLTK